MTASSVNYKITCFFLTNQGAEVSKTSNNLKSRKWCDPLRSKSIYECFNNWCSSGKRTRIMALTGIGRKQSNFNKFFRRSVDFMTVLNGKKLYWNIQIIKTDIRNRKMEYPNSHLKITSLLNSIQHLRKKQDQSCKIFQK